MTKMTKSSLFFLIPLSFVWWLINLFLDFNLFNHTCACFCFSFTSNSQTFTQICEMMDFARMDEFRDSESDFWFVIVIFTDVRNTYFFSRNVKTGTMPLLLFMSVFCVFRSIDVFSLQVLRLYITKINKKKHCVCLSC